MPRVPRGGLCLPTVEPATVPRKVGGWVVLGSAHGPGCACACAAWALQARLGSCSLMLASTLSAERRRASWTPHSSSPTTCRWSRRPRLTRCERRWLGRAVRSCSLHARRSGAQRSCFSPGSGPNQVRRSTTLLCSNCRFDEKAEGCVKVVLKPGQAVAEQ